MTWGFSLTLSFVTSASLLIFLLKNPDKFEHWAALCYRGLLFLTSNLRGLRQRFDRGAVALSIQDSVNGVSESIDREAPGALPHALKIEWVHSDSREAFLKDGRVVVRLKPFQNQNQNLVEATLLFLKVGMLPRSRHHLDKRLRNGCELKIAARILSSNRGFGAYDYFYEHVLSDHIRLDADLMNDLALLDQLDSIGFFTHVFLEEIKFLGEKLVGVLSPQNIQQELRSFARFLQGIAVKAINEDVPLGFKGAKIKVAVVIVAKRPKIERHGIRPYVNRIRNLVLDDYESIYVTGWGADLVEQVLEIKKEVIDALVTVLKRYEYHLGDGKKAVLLACQSNLSYLAERRQFFDDIRRALTEVVPEVRSGQIEVVSVSRLPNVGCKVSIRRASSAGDSLNIVGACIGTNSERVNVIRARLNNERIGFVEWSSDINEYITNALTPLLPQQIERIDLDEENLVAHVIVSDENAYKKGIGKNKSNAQLAGYLVGWAIEIITPAVDERVPTPVDEARKAVRDGVPAIKGGKIEIIRIARIKGKGIRVLIRAIDAQGDIRPLDACRGENNENQRRLQEKLQWEWISFHEWNSNPSILIKRSLYPLKESDIADIKCDTKRKVATITLIGNPTSPSTWNDPDMIHLSAKITGWKIDIQKSPPVVGEGSGSGLTS